LRWRDKSFKEKKDDVVVKKREDGMGRQKER